MPLQDAPRCANQRRHPIRLRTVLVALVLMSMPSVARADAWSDGWTRLAPARAALAVNDMPRARALMFDLVVDAQTPDATLALIARLGFHLVDRDVLQELRSVLDERVEADGRNEVRDLAEGWAFLGLARVYIQTQSNGSSIPLLFTDAQRRADTLIAGTSDASIRSGARLLAARVQAAQAKRVESLAALTLEKDEALKKDESHAATWKAGLDGLEARLLYDRGAKRPYGANGRPTTEALADLARAYALIASALRDPTDMGTNRQGIESLIARRAWASHRLGEVDRAVTEYTALYDRGSQGRILAVRGLGSLLANNVKRLDSELAAWVASKGAEGTTAHEALVDAAHTRRDFAAALIAAQAYIKAFDSPTAWSRHADVLRSMQAWTEAEASYAKALTMDETFVPAARGLELMARDVFAIDAPRAIEMYETLLRVRPNDPFTRNNLGFFLRDLVTPYTTMLPGNLQKIKADAPPYVRAWLDRSVSAYAEAVALIDESADGGREMVDDWNYAGIVNDLGLMLHYFVDVQDGPRAEALYLRALRMTENGFKDTYAPNLQRLYTFVIKGRELQWLRLATACADSIMKEQPNDQGAFEIVPDDAKNESAHNDIKRLRTQILKELGITAD